MRAIRRVIIPAAVLLAATAGVASPASAVTVGQELCSDGSFTDEACSVRISAINACLDLSDEDGNLTHVCNQALGDAIGSGIIVQHGDSGGPVYDLSADPNVVLACGIISGGDTTTGLHMNFTQYTSFESKFGVGIA